MASNESNPLNSQSRQARTRQLGLDGMRVAYRELGVAHAGTPLVLLQRFRGTMDHWDPDLLDRLATRRHVILFDSPGVGRSDGEVPDSIAGMAQRAGQVIRALGHTRVDVLGWSLGGMMAQQLCLEHSSLVRRAVVAGSTPGPVPNAPRAADKVWQVSSKPVNDDQDFLYLFWTDSPAGLAAGRAHLERLRSRAEEFSPPVTAESFKRQLGSIMAWAGGQGCALPRLDQIGQPVLVANGFADRMVAAYSSFVMAQSLRAGKLVLYPDAGHAFLFQHIDAFAGDVLNFLEEQDAPDVG